MSIRVLSDLVVAQIAAGEVVERPASVVKELVENSLDARATHIRIEISGGGRKRIRISDDGMGILPDEVELAFHRHATSKLQTTEDLLRIETLGFRGEALASIASVSQVSISTRHHNLSMGILLNLEGGEIVRHQSVGAPIGTIITVENLFFNTPARLKFLKKENTEKRQIALFVTRYAMAYPHVKFILEQDGREAFRSSGSGQLADVLVAALGLDSFKNMVEVSAQEENREDRYTTITGYTSVPNLHRADRNHITLFVNGRWIQDTRLSYAVTQAYHTFLMTGRFPVSVLMIRLPTAEVDVNVHPTKAEVRFRDTDQVFAAIQRAVRRAVIDLAQTPAMRGGHFAGLTSRNDHLPSWAANTYQNQLDMDLSLDNPGQHRRQSLLTPAVDFDPAAIPAGMGLPAKPRTLPILRVIGQVGATYIVAEGPSGLYLIDQHAAHERILYEQFMEEHNRHEKTAQLTLTAQTINLPPIEARLLEENFDILQGIGFDLEPFGPNIYIIRSVPALLADESPLEVLGGILADLEVGNQPGQASIEEKIITRVCKQAAVKAGQILSVDEMQNIIRQLERCQSPHTCPHGRPTMLHMTGEQLAREFGRLG